MPQPEVAELADVFGYMRRGVFFGGAGVSTESGIPDFRSEATLELAEELYGHPPEELLSIEFARQNPVTFHRFFREAKPNPAHLALARLEAEGKLAAVVTQNIDGLHQQAGSRNVFELHGSVWRHHCVECGARYGLDWTFDPSNCRAPERIIPVCQAVVGGETCGGWVRPNVVLYGEALPDAAVSGAVEAIREADVIVVGGTSLVVYPAAGLLGYFQGHTRAIINLEQTPYDDEADLVIHAPIGEVLASAANVPGNAEGAM
jgi:NAD-dependent deacetylase